MSVSTRKNSERAKEEDWTCNVCKKIFTEAKAELLECEYCSKHYCRQCLGMTSTDYKTGSRRNDFHWFCPHCEPKAISNIKINKEIEQRCKEFFDKYEERIEKLEVEVTKKVDEETVIKLIEESKSGEAIAANHNSKNIEEINEKLDDYKESMARRCNIVIFNAEESGKSEPEDRKNDDMDIVKQLCTITKANHKSVRNVARIRKNQKIAANQDL